MNATSETRAARIGGVRDNALAAIVMLLLEYLLGMWVNLYGSVPVADAGAGFAAEVVRAIAHGPLGLSLHVILGLLLLVTGTVALVRCIRVGGWPTTVTAGVALLLLLTAALAGDRFAATDTVRTSWLMALATGLAILCYSLLLHRLLPPREQEVEAVA